MVEPADILLNVVVPEESLTGSIVLGAVVEPAVVGAVTDCAPACV